LPILRLSDELRFKNKTMSKGLFHEIFFILSLVLQDKCKGQDKKPLVDLKFKASLCSLMRSCLEIHISSNKKRKPPAAL
jgi:hypothetical protein